MTMHCTGHGEQAMQLADEQNQTEPRVTNFVELIEFQGIGIAALPYIHELTGTIVVAPYSSCLESSREPGESIPRVIAPACNRFLRTRH